MAAQRTVHFSGHVQGVGFRYTTCRIARGFDVAGFVKNLPDGRVKVVAEGDEKELDAFVSAIQSEMGGMIRDTKSNDAPATGRFSDFNVAY